MNRDWVKAVGQAWRLRHEEVREIHQKLTVLPADPDEDLAPDTLWEKAKLLLELGGDETAQPELSQLLRKEPEHAAACFLRGRSLLAKEDIEGIEWIERSMGRDSAFTMEGLNLLYEYFATHGMKERLRDGEGDSDECSVTICFRDFQQTRAERQQRKGDTQ